MMAFAWTNTEADCTIVSSEPPEAGIVHVEVEPGTDPGEFNIAHNITCDADGWYACKSGSTRTFPHASGTASSTVAAGANTLTGFDGGGPLRLRHHSDPLRVPPIAGDG